MLTHSGEKPYSCDVCGKEFRYSSNMIMHKRSHGGDKNFECAVCRLTQPHSHLDDKNMNIFCIECVCDFVFHFQVCAKKFISKEQLKRHLTIHTGAKPHKCDTCGKCFNRRSTLKVTYGRNEPVDAIKMTVLTRLDFIVFSRFT